MKLLAAVTLAPMRGNRGPGSFMRPYLKNKVAGGSDVCLQSQNNSGNRGKPSLLGKYQDKTMK